MCYFTQVNTKLTLSENENYTDVVQESHTSTSTSNQKLKTVITMAVRVDQIVGQRTKKLS